MEGYKTFVQVMDLASSSCSQWRSVEDGTVFTYDEMMEIAAYLDAAFPVIGHSWYVAFPDGEIGLLNEDEKEIIRLFYPLASPSVRVKAGTDTPPAGKPAFCMYCGARLLEEARFCPQCGKKV